MQKRMEYGWVGAEIVACPFLFDVVDGAEHPISSPIFDAPATEEEFIFQEEQKSERLRLALDKSNAHAGIAIVCNTVRERISASTHYIQTARWAVQLAAAQAILQGGGTELDIEMMALEARLRGMGETVEDLAQKVIRNSRVFTLVGAAVDGVERAANDAIAAYQGTDPVAYDGIVATARATLRTELIAIIAPIQGEAVATAMVTAILGPEPEPPAGD